MPHVTSETGTLFYRMDDTTANIKYYCCYCSTMINISRKLFSCLKYFHIYFLIAKWVMTYALSFLEAFRGIWEKNLISKQIYWHIFVEIYLQIMKSLHPRDFASFL